MHQPNIKTQEGILKHGHLYENCIRNVAESQAAKFPFMCTRRSTIELNSCNKLCIFGTIDRQLMVTSKFSTIMDTPMKLSLSTSNFQILIFFANCSPWNKHRILTVKIEHIATKSYLQVPVVSQMRPSPKACPDPLSSDESVLSLRIPGKEDRQLTKVD